MVTHGRIPTIGPFLAFHYGAMDVGNDGLGVHDRSMRIYCKFGLETKGQQCGSGEDRTHIEDMKDPVEI